MLLTQTKTTGYSLGLPLWWPDIPDRVSTGWVQGISLTLRGAPRTVYLTKYQRLNKNLKLVFSDGLGLLCSLDAKIGTKPEVYRLSSLSSDFIDGYVTFCGPNYADELDLSGAQVCPKYITFISDSETHRKELVIVQATVSNEILSVVTADLSVLTVTNSTSVATTITNDFNYILEDVVATVDVVIEDNNVYTISGAPSDGVGNVLIELPSDWRIVKVGADHIKIGITGTRSSCPDADYINQRLSPGNFAQSCPLEAVFSTIGNKSILDMQKVVCAKFNTDYENGGNGLSWDDFSTFHDSTTV